MEPTVSPSLSKSLFIRGRQCHKSLWLHKHQPELRDPADAEQETRFRSGHEVGDLARELYPDGVLVPYEGLTVAEQVEMTRKLVEAGERTIYEASFLYGDVFVKTDILTRIRGGWMVCEVKSSTGVKDLYLWDLALQLHVLLGDGVPVTRAVVAHIDTSYVRQGALDVRALFRKADVTAEVLALQPQVAKELRAQRRMLGRETPKVDIGPHCSDPYDCDFRGHCWSHIPEDSVFDLRGRGADPFELYRRGIVHMAQIPPEELNDRQRRQVESTLARRNSSDADEVRAFLSSLWHPLCYLDFETVNPAVPLFDRSRPYQQIPFQYSLHIQRSPGGPLAHHEYLGQPGVDPRPELTRRLLADVPKDACLVAWNQGFERGVLSGLASLYPRHKRRIGGMLESFRDPMGLFRSQAVVLWRQKGSYSIKAVLPLMAPDLGYDDLEVADGGMAMAAYYEMAAAESAAEVARIRAALLAYCKRDTLAMVRIVDKLRVMAA